MNKFLKEIQQGLIHFRDRHQFELKSEFLHHSALPEINYTQEFYLFIPEALQINQITYPKEQFYRDQTNFIRFKTPIFTLPELAERGLERSPLFRLEQLCNSEQSATNQQAVQDEAKLLGNVVRSALREGVRELIEQCRERNSLSLNEELPQLITDITMVQNRFEIVKKEYMKSWKDQVLRQHISYLGTFIRHAIDFHLTGLLQFLRQHKIANLQETESSLCELIRRQNPLQVDKNDEKMEFNGEYFQYQKGLLNKFMMDALKLNIRRRSLVDRYHNFIAMSAAGIAMLIFLIGVAVQGEVFLVNSAPFILITTLLYIIKDRIKEGLKAAYQMQASLWLPDYSTEIFTPNGEYQIGTLKEVFSYIPLHKLPEEIEKIRNREFHNVLEIFRRSEKVISYKSEVTLKGLPEREGIRRYNLNTIFRLNIHRFLEKASDTHTTYTTLEAESSELLELKLPKVYHINIIVKNSFTGKDCKPKTELQKFRLVIDKDGIKRVEQNLPSAR